MKGALRPLFLFQRGALATAHAQPCRLHRWRHCNTAPQSTPWAQWYPRNEESPL